MAELNDHQDSEHFLYDKSWKEIEDMLDDAERRLNYHLTKISRKNISKKQQVYHLRNYKALQGVIKTLRWVLGDISIQDPLE